MNGVYQIFTAYYYLIGKECNLYGLKILGLNKVKKNMRRKIIPSHYSFKLTKIKWLIHQCPISRQLAHRANYNGPAQPLRSISVYTAYLYTH